MKKIIIILIVFMLMSCAASRESMDNNGAYSQLVVKDNQGNYYKLHWHFDDAYYIEDLSKMIKETEEKISEF